MHRLVLLECKVVILPQLLELSFEGVNRVLERCAVFACGGLSRLNRRSVAVHRLLQTVESLDLHCSKSAVQHLPQQASLRINGTNALSINRSNVAVDIVPIGIDRGTQCLVNRLVFFEGGLVILPQLLELSFEDVDCVLECRTAFG